MLKLRTNASEWTLALLASLGVTAIAPGCGPTTETGGKTKVEPETCEGAKRYPVGSPDPTGFEQCANGLIHRPRVVACGTSLPREGTVCSDGAGGGAPAPACTLDTDCKGANAFCDRSDFEGSCFCNTGCESDADCEKGNICVCGENGPIGQCVPSSCTSDADCGVFFCAPYDSEPGCGFTKFACQTALDSCKTNDDCSSGQSCSLVNGVRECVDQGCAIGRPFLVEDVARLSPIVSRTDWLGSEMPKTEGLSRSARAALADHWTHAARMEHASIASFARFVLDLLALGAPPELVTAAQQAMADETRHATLCFAFASAYAGTSIGPGPLSIDGALENRNAHTIVATAIIEGCVGETVAALEALEEAADASDPVVREALRGIAADETRHAELAWRFVAWAVGRFPELRPDVERTFDAAMATRAASGTATTRAILDRAVAPVRAALLCAA